MKYLFSATVIIALTWIPRAGWSSHVPLDSPPVDTGKSHAPTLELPESPSESVLTPGHTGNASRNHALEPNGDIASAMPLSNISYLWKDGVVPYEISPDLAADHRTEIFVAMEKIEATTRVRFIPRSVHLDYVSIEYQDVDPDTCFSPTGRGGGKQVFGVSRQGCGERGTLHELGHVLGLVHEHARPDRDQYIEVFEENISAQHLRHFDKRRDADEESRPYDLHSVMHYAPDVFSESGLPTFRVLDQDLSPTWTANLSAGDVETLRAMYPAPDLLATVIVERADAPSKIVIAEGLEQAMETIQREQAAGFHLAALDSATTASEPVFVLSLEHKARDQDVTIFDAWAPFVSELASRNQNSWVLANLEIASSSQGLQLLGVWEQSDEPFALTRRTTWKDFLNDRRHASLKDLALHRVEGYAVSGQQYFVGLWEPRKKIGFRPHAFNGVASLMNRATKLQAEGWELADLEHTGTLVSDWFLGLWRRRSGPKREIWRDIPLADLSDRFRSNPNYGYRVVDIELERPWRLRE